ncbi:endochitinase [Thraustotheca clavata]|uniref:Endochitinase n=1 Tax=Thraustotheca clavata TaxID=74557 RepID=A0A0A7CMB6_9STRA|nr:secreted protein [Thraustotheca clavata]OQS02258.1 endochitinase [Thraustotheca clavata]
MLRVLLPIALAVFASAGSCPNAPRPDGRCGPSFGNAGCVANSNYPCCSTYGWCGKGNGYCDANVCKGTSTSSCPNAPRSDGRCGPDFGNAGCDTKSNYPCCSKYGWCGNGSGYCDSNICSGGKPSPSPSSKAPAPVPGTNGIKKYLPESQFNQLFPNRNPTYTYQHLVSMAAKYSSFANSGNADNDKRELAAFLAHVTHETGTLVYTEEIDKSGPYAPYIGRGAMQLTWKNNYQAFGNAIGRDLVTNYASVATNADLVWWSALWYWFQNGLHGPAGQKNQFAQTTRTINGAMECGSNPPNTQGDPHRVALFQQYCRMFGVDPGTQLSCKN